MSAPVVRWDAIESPLGVWSFAATPAGLCRLSFGGEERSLRDWVERWEPEARLVRDPQALRSTAAQLAAYARGERRTFALPLDLRGSPFELAAWAAMSRIPFGRTRTYGELASELGVRAGARAVGRAAGANPVPVVVPCHRVLAAGGLGGFSGGLEHKRSLLAHEGHALQLELW